ncbi:hypothetical protein CANCADRAFT_57243 [Tortispora caseinolytica NRRL Y-17796]|uniref:Uncharacterized protein n=1 Tax=Tortispora caseinolytica NRRL Y-17796 TaxID=767744 RepID=A0A1E4TGC0_9ASCO|nr:hypothetical protein CANCADRAFT_57243 [Tortispora caseinolytica NRRL Y-17796]
MFWRKSKTEHSMSNLAASNNASLPKQYHRSTHSRNLSSNALHIPQREPRSNFINFTTGHVRGFRSSDSSISVENDAQARVLQNERRSLVSIYILCRVLLEVIRQAPPEVLGTELSEKLEEIIFRQLRDTDPESLASSASYRANWTLFAQLLGEMSERRFASTSDYFIAELEKPVRADINKEATKMNESNIEVLIYGMRYLKLKIYPPEAFDETVDFLSCMAEFFSVSHGRKIKQAYATILHHLLFPVSTIITLEANNPTWIKATEIIYVKTQSMVTKQKYWAHLFPLLCTVLCVSTQDFFSKHWSVIIENHAAKYRDSSTRAIYLASVSRLLWVYLFRYPESLNNVVKRLDQITKILLPSNKKSFLYTADLGPMEAHVSYVIRCIGYNHREYCFTKLLSPLLNMDALNSSGSNVATLSLDTVHPERAITGILCYAEMLGDRASGTPPEMFPDDDTDSVVSKGINSLHEPFKAVQLGQLTGAFQDFHASFLQIIGKLLILIDAYYGGQVAVDDQGGVSAPGSIRTPVTATFGFTSDMLVASKQVYYDLFLVIISVLPRCVPSNVTKSKLIEVLCHATAHPDVRISRMAYHSLREFAVGSDSCLVISVFSRFLGTVGEKFSSSSEYETNQLARLEKSLKLYIDFLYAWRTDLRKRLSGSNENDKPTEDIDFVATLSTLEDAEGLGLFFLCSQARSVRQSAISIFKIVRGFDEILKSPDSSEANSSTKHEYSRLIDILESKEAFSILSKLQSPKEGLSVAESGRLSKLLQSKPASVFSRLATSDYGIDSALWFRTFPHLVTLFFNTFPIPVALCRDLVCRKIVNMDLPIRTIADSSKPVFSSGIVQDLMFKHTMRTGPELLIEQWKLYLTFACSTITLTDSYSTADLNSSSNLGNERKAPSNHPGSPQKILSAKALFQLIRPLLKVDQVNIREALVSGLAYINVNLYPTLIESLDEMMRSWTAEVNLAQTHRRTLSGNINIRKQGKLVIEVTHVFQLTSRYLNEPSVCGNEDLLKRVVDFTKLIKDFLSNSEIRVDISYQKLMRYFCGLVENLYTALVANGIANKWFPFEARISCFTLIEEWLLQLRNVELNYDTYNRVRSGSDESSRNTADRELAIAAMTIEKNNLELAALKSMAALCAGAVSHSLGSKDQSTVLALNVKGLLQWVDSVLSSNSDQKQDIGRTALYNLLKFNSNNPVFLKEAIAQSYAEKVEVKASWSYFSVVCRILQEISTYPCTVSAPLALALFRLGDDNREARTEAIELLSAIESRFFKSSHSNEFKTSVLDRTTVVYKHAQFELASRFAAAQPEIAFEVFSELSMFFNIIGPKKRKDMLAVILPWVQALELSTEIDTEVVTYPTFMVLSNLFEITVKFSDQMQTEVEALWVALGSGRFPKNIDVVLGFVMHTGIERRDPAFLETSKQVIVHLSSSPSASKLEDTLTSYFTPRFMVPYHKEYSVFSQPDNFTFPYIADLNKVLLPPLKQSSFSLAQIALILLVDLLVKPLPLIESNLALILQVSFVLMDHYVPIVSDQARELLVHVIHICASSSSSKASLDVIDLLRRKAPVTVWQYDDFSRDKSGLRKTKNMDATIDMVLQLFPGAISLQEEWSKIALKWAATCPVQHVACRSFQIFRNTFSSLDFGMLADMLARLSNTISDPASDIQGFCIQILMTLRTLVTKLDSDSLKNLPQIFWTVYAGLDTIHENEYLELLQILESLLDKVYLDDPNAFVATVNATMPGNWAGAHNILHLKVTYGLRSSVSYPTSLRVLEKLNKLPDTLVMDSDNRVLYSLLAFFPQFSHSIEINGFSDVEIPAVGLASLAGRAGLTQLERLLSSFAKGRIRKKEDFMQQVSNAIINLFFPKYESATYIFLMSCLSNKTKWIRKEILYILTKIMPSIDLQSVEFSAAGADLISPLLRLLQSEFADQVLEVLDNTNNIAGNSKDKHVLRMSLGNRTVRKEYEKSETLFGVPDENGWSVPSATNQTQVVRNNIHVVFYTCVPTDTVDYKEADLDGKLNDLELGEIEFQEDESSYSSIFRDRTDQANSTLLQTQSKASLSHMWAELDNLDSFFTDDRTNHLSTHHPSFSQTSMEGDRSDTEFDYSDGPSESAAQLYDANVLTILNKTISYDNYFSAF